MTDSNIKIIHTLYILCQMIVGEAFVHNQILGHESDTLKERKVLEFLGQ